MAVVVVNVGGGSGGKQIISGRMRGSSPTQPEPLFIQWGTGAGTAAVADTGLFSTSTTTEARTTGVSTQQAGAQTLSKWQVVGTITAAGARTILEVGLFDTVGSSSPPTGGNFFLHADHGSTTLATNDTITYTISIDFTP